MLSWARPAPPQGFSPPEPVGPDDCDPKVWAKARGQLVAAHGARCAYCERIRDGSRELDVEHFRPSGRVTLWAEAPELERNVPPREFDCRGTGYWWLAHRWENWALACKTCNSGWKRNLFPVVGEHADPLAQGCEAAEHPLLLDPGERFETREHFSWSGGSIEATSPRGRATIIACGLNRDFLPAGRLSLQEDWDSRLSDARRTGKWERVARMGARTSEFAGMVRWLTEEALGCRWADHPVLGEVV
jgi:hypothetical protein